MPVSKNALLRAVRDYRATEPKIRFYEPQDVKPKILANAIKQCCPDIPEKDVVALLDENYPRRGKCCLVLTLDTLYLSSGHLVRGNSSKHWVRISDIVSTQMKTEKDIYRYVEVAHEDGTSEWIFSPLLQEDLYDLFTKLIVYSQEEAKAAASKPEPAPENLPASLEDRAQEIKKQLALLRKLRGDTAQPEEVFDEIDELTGFYCNTCLSEIYPTAGTAFVCCPVCSTRQTVAEVKKFNKEYLASLNEQAKVSSKRSQASEKGHALFEKENYRAALDAYMEAANLGSTTAMYNVAVCYNNLYAQAPESKQEVSLLFSAWEWLEKAKNNGCQLEGSEYYHIRNEIKRSLMHKKAFDFAHEYIWAECIGASTDRTKEYAEYLAKHATTEEEFQTAQRWAKKCTDLPYGEGFSIFPLQSMYRRREELAMIYPEKKQFHLEKALELALELISYTYVYTIVDDFTIMSLYCDLDRFAEAESWGIKHQVSRSDMKMVKRRKKLAEKKK